MTSIKPGMMFVSADPWNFIDIIIFIGEDEITVLRTGILNETSLFQFYKLDSKGLARKIQDGNYWSSKHWYCINV